MPHLALLGDSVFANAAYVAPGRTVIDHVRAALPRGWSATLVARDGDTTAGVPAQLAALPQTATHLAVSIGGNDLLMKWDLIRAPAASSTEVLAMLADAAADFARAYTRALDLVLARGLLTVVCTVYHPNYPDALTQKVVAPALAVFDDVILRAALRRGVGCVELRSVFSDPADYANPIEPSDFGGRKLAAALVRAIEGVGGVTVWG